jgi:hypothetical protein
LATNGTGSEDKIIKGENKINIVAPGKADKDGKTTLNIEQDSQKKKAE